MNAPPCQYLLLTTNAMSNESNYIERHRRWQDQAINQLSTANNFLLTISTGLLAFVFDKEVFSKIHFSLCLREVSKSMTLYGFSLAFILIALTTGIIVLITRLYDFRLTRHIVFVRQRFYSKNKDKITDKNKNAAVLSDNGFDTPSFLQRLNSIFKVLFVKIDFITKEQMSLPKESFPTKEFRSIREHSHRLGIISWKWTKLQALYFLVAVCFYCLYLWAK
jgi:hypothetical protein